MSQVIVGKRRSSESTVRSLPTRESPVFCGDSLELAGAPSTTAEMYSNKQQNKQQNVMDARSSMDEAINCLKQGLGVGSLNLHSVIAKGGFGTVFQGVCSLTASAVSYRAPTT